MSGPRDEASRAAMPVLRERRRASVPNLKYDEGLSRVDTRGSWSSASELGAFGAAVRLGKRYKRRIHPLVKSALRFQRILQYYPRSTLHYPMTRFAFALLAFASAALATPLASTTTVAPPTPTAVQIHPNGNNAKCLDVQAAVFANGTPVQMYVFSTSQYFHSSL